MKHIRLDRCGSTNDEARVAFEAGEPLPFLLSTEYQTAGRGRNARSWLHDPANFAGTFALPLDEFFRKQPGLLSLLAGVAVVDALIAHGANSSDLALKWPNDVLRAEQKIAGVLAEILSASADQAVIIGIGVNLSTAPPDDQSFFPPGTAFLAGEVDPATFGDTLGQALLQQRKSVLQGGAPALINRWRSQAWRIGRSLTMTVGADKLSGEFRDITDDGHMVLVLPSGERRVLMAGDASHR